MQKLVRRKRGVGGLILAVLLLAILILTVPAIVYGDDGISQPGDGLNSAPPPVTEQPLTFLESVLLYTTLS
jgi:hypothetical protein